MSCNFGLKSYLWFQIELALRACSILKSCIWFKPKLHSTQFNYHYLSRDTIDFKKWIACPLWATAVNPYRKKNIFRRWKIKKIKKFIYIYIYMGGRGGRNCSLHVLKTNIYVYKYKYIMYIIYIILMFFFNTNRLQFLPTPYIYIHIYIYIYIYIYPFSF